MKKENIAMMTVTLALGVSVFITMNTTIGVILRSILITAGILFIGILSWGRASHKEREDEELEQAKKIEEWRVKAAKLDALDKQAEKFIRALTQARAEADAKMMSEIMEQSANSSESSETIPPDEGTASSVY